MADAPTTLTLIPPGQEDQYREFNAPSFLRVEIDKSTMYAKPLLITTDSEDRQGEIIDPAGGILDMHRSNPVICYQHSHKLAPMMPPVGIAETPEHKYDVSLVNGALYSGCLFSQATKLANQIFALVDEGMIRARSIGAIGHKLEPYTPTAPGQVLWEGKIVPARVKSVIYRLWEMLEWSWVLIPANRDITIAMKSMLSHGKVIGERMDPFLEMTMKALDLSEPLQVPGFDFFTKSVGGVDYRFPRQLHDGGSQMKGAAFVLFDGDKVTPGVAKSFLAANPDLIETGLKFDPRHKCLKSVQVEYDGPVDLVSVDGVPGVRVGIIKCDATATQMSKTATTKAEGDDVTQATVNPNATVVIPGMEAKGEVPAVPEVAVEDAPPEITGLPGSRLLQALSSGIDELKGLLGTALETDQEDPTVIEKGTELLQMLGDMSTSVKEIHDGIYTKPDAVKLMKQAAEGDAVPEEPDGDEAPVPVPEADKKKMLAKFYRQHQPVGLPSVVVTALQGVFKSLPATAATQEGRMALQQMLKGVMPAKPQPEPYDKSPMGEIRKAMAQRSQRAALQTRLRGLIAPNK